jgi:hypothetical protein
MTQHFTHICRFFRAAGTPGVRAAPPVEKLIKLDIIKK